MKRYIALALITLFVSTQASAGLLPTWFTNFFVVKPNPAVVNDGP